MGLLWTGSGHDITSGGVVIAEMLETFISGSGLPIPALEGQIQAAVRSDMAGKIPIIGATQANPVRITTGSPHGLLTGANVEIVDIVGMVELNDRFFDITVISPTELDLDGEDGTGHTAYVSDGDVDSTPTTDLFFIHIFTKVPVDYIIAVTPLGDPLTGSWWLD